MSGPALPPRVLVLLAVGALAVVISACKRPSIRTYEAKRDPGVYSFEEMAAPVHGPGRAAGPEWALPDGWQQERAGPMQLARFVTRDGSTVSISAVPGPAGGLLANLNRWRSQLGLSPLAESDVPAVVQTVRLGVADWHLVILRGTIEDRRAALGVCWTSRGDCTWFVKLAGPAGSVDAQLPAFRDFVASLRLPAP